MGKWAFWSRAAVLILTSLALRMGAPILGMVVGTSAFQVYVSWGHGIAVAIGLLAGISAWAAGYAGQEHVLIAMDDFLFGDDEGHE